MALKIARFIALLLAAVGFGLTLAHVLEAPGERALSGDAWLVILLVTTLQDTRTKGAGD